MDDFKKMFKASEFLHNIGLLSAPVEKTSAAQTNIVKFQNPKVHFPDMDVPEYAVSVQLSNLIATYGITMVQEGLADLKKLRGL